METAVATPARVARAHRPAPRFWTVVAYVFLTLGAITTLLPFLFMLTSAFKPAHEVIAYPPVWITANPTLENIERVWTKINFARFFMNSLIIATAVTVIVLATSSLVGYVLAKFEFWGRNVFFIAVLMTMMIPWPITLLPRYQLMVWFGLINTFGALIVPAFYNSFGIFMMRQFMHSIPNELIDAARIDGASEPRIFTQIVLPLAGPALAALGILEFLWSWDAFIWPLLVLNKKDMYTLPIGLATFITDQFADYPALMGGAIITVIPIFIVYIALQRYFVAGIALTGLKG